MGEWLSGGLKIRALVATSVRIRPLLLASWPRGIGTGLRTQARRGNVSSNLAGAIRRFIMEEKAIDILRSVHMRLHNPDLSKQDIDDYIDETGILK